MNNLTGIGRIFDHLIVGFAWLAGFLMMLALVLVCMDVILRYFFNNPTGWVIQISEYLLLYIPFLAAAYALREDSHVQIDIVLNRLSPGTRSLVNMITSVIGSLVLLVLTYYGALICLDYYHRGVPTLKYLKFPEYLVIMIIPFGCFLFSIQFLRKAFGCYRKYAAKTDP